MSVTVRIEPLPSGEVGQSSLVPSVWMAKLDWTCPTLYGWNATARGEADRNQDRSRIPESVTGPPPATPPPPAQRPPAPPAWRALPDSPGSTRLAWPARPRSARAIAAGVAFCWSSYRTTSRPARRVDELRACFHAQHPTRHERAAGRHSIHDHHRPLRQAGLERRGAALDEGHLRPAQRPWAVINQSPSDLRR